MKTRKEKTRMNKRMTSSLFLLMCVVLLSTSILPTAIVFAETTAPTTDSGTPVPTYGTLGTDLTDTSRVPESQRPTVPSMEDKAEDTILPSQEILAEEPDKNTIQPSSEDKKTQSEQSEDNQDSQPTTQGTNLIPQTRGIITDTWGTCPFSFDTSNGILTVSAGTLGIVEFPAGEIFGSIRKDDVKKIVFEKGVIAASDSSYLFYACTNLTSVEGELDTSNVTNMEGMFGNTKKLENLDVSQWDTSNVTNMGEMFGSSAVTQLDVSQWDTSNVTNMGEMFDNSKVTSLDVSKWDTSNVYDMKLMFELSVVTQLDVSQWDTSNVTTMFGMFSNSKVTSLDVSQWDTSNVTDRFAMFIGSKLNTLILGQYSKFEKNVSLPAIDASTGEYTGKWERTSPKIPISEYDSSDDFMDKYDGSQPGIYVWQKVKVPAKDLTIFYQDTEGNKISESKTISGNIGDTYNESAPEIKDYTFKEVKDHVMTQGTLSNQEQSIIFIYSKNPVEAQDLTVFYQDTDGNTIFEPKTVSGNVGDKFNEVPLDIKGYAFKEVKDKVAIQGTLSDQKQSIIFIYTKNLLEAQDLTVFYQDTNGNKISEYRTVSGNVGDKFNEAPLDIEGYTFKEVKDSAPIEGTLSEKKQSITFIYTKNSTEPSKDKNEKVSATGIAGSSNKHKDLNPLPKTGEKISPMATFVGVTILLLALSLWLSIRKQSNQ